MGRINLDPLLTFPDGSHLVISTLRLNTGDFSCTLYTATVSVNDDAAFRMISNHLEASTCIAAQEYAYSHAVQLFPRSAESLKKPPYLIWHGPQSFAQR